MHTSLMLLLMGVLLHVAFGQTKHVSICPMDEPDTIYVYDSSIMFKNHYEYPNRFLYSVATSDPDLCGHRTEAAVVVPAFGYEQRFIQFCPPSTVLTVTFATIEATEIVNISVRMSDGNTTETLVYAAGKIKSIPCNGVVQFAKDWSSVPHSDIRINDPHVKRFNLDLTDIFDTYNFSDEKSDDQPSPELSTTPTLPWDYPLISFNTAPLILDNTASLIVTNTGPSFSETILNMPQPPSQEVLDKLNALVIYPRVSWVKSSAETVIPGPTSDMHEFKGTLPTDYDLDYIFGPAVDTVDSLMRFADPAEEYRRIAKRTAMARMVIQDAIRMRRITGHYDSVTDTITV